MGCGVSGALTQRQGGVGKDGCEAIVVILDGSPLWRNIYVMRCKGKTQGALRVRSKASESVGERTHEAVCSNGDRKLD